MFGRERFSILFVFAGGALALAVHDVTDAAYLPSWMPDPALHAPYLLVRPVAAPRAVLDAADVPVVMLPPLTLTLEELNAARVPGERAWRIGLHRAPREAGAGWVTDELPDWQRGADGRWYSAMTIVAPGARGLRAGLALDDLPDATQIAFVTASIRWLTTAAAARLIIAPARSEQARAYKTGAATAAAPLYWSPSVAGDTLRIELSVPPRATPPAGRARVVQIAHLLLDPDQPLPTRAVGEAARCHLDLTCDAVQAESTPARATALMRYEDGGYSNGCTGTLIADAARTATPYFLTAAHCIDSAAEAASLETGWWFVSSACHSLLTDRRYVRRTGGARWLATVSKNDMTLLQLNETPPPGAAFIGTLTTYGALNQVLGIHHPQSDHKKISWGIFDGFEGYDSGPWGDDHLRVNWTRGVTEPGSSGSGLFVPVGNDWALVGTLHGGYSECVGPRGPDFYGRFDQAYAARLGQWLGDGTAPVACAITPLASDTAVAGEWRISDCESLHYPGYYADYYRFTLTQPAVAVATLDSTAADAYLLLLTGERPTGPVLEEDDDSGGNLDARIAHPLAAGVYLLEATTAEPGATGAYRLALTTEPIVRGAELAWRVAELYVAIMGEPPDAQGLDYWVRQIERDPAWSVLTVAQSFFDQPLVQARYPAELPIEVFLEALYEHLFARAPDPAGLAYWQAELEQGRIARNQAIIALIDGGWANPAGFADMARFGQRVRFALAFAAAQRERGIVYDRLTPAQQTALRQIGRELLATVTADPATREAASARLLSVIGP